MAAWMPLAIAALIPLVSACTNQRSPHGGTGVELAVESLARIDEKQRAGEEYAEYYGRITKEIARVVARVNSAGELRELFYLCVQRAHEAPAKSQEELTEVAVFFDAQLEIMGRLADMRNDEAARVLVGLLADPSLDFDGDSAETLEECIIECGAACRPYLERLSRERYKALVADIVAESRRRGVRVDGGGPTSRSARSLDAESLAARLERKLSRGDVGYGPHELIPVSDFATKERYHVCIVQGGPTYDQDGVVGLFTEDGRLVDWREIKGLESYIDGVDRSLVSSYLPDSIVLRVLEESGTGVHVDSLLVIAAINGKLEETFRGTGNLVRISRGENGVHIERRIAKLAFANLGSGQMNSLIWMAYETRDAVGTSRVQVYGYEAARHHFETLGGVIPGSR